MRSKRRGGGAARQMVIGLGVIVAGMLFLLDNLGIIDFVDVSRLWPVALVLFGVLKYSQSADSRGRTVGAAMAGVGVVLLLRAVGVLDISWSVLGPVLMIAGGLLVVFRSLRDREEGAPASMLDKDNDRDAGLEGPLRLFTLLGGIQRRVFTPDFRGGEVTAIMGGCELDLRQASIQGEAVLNVFAMWGGIEIKVPDDWTVSLEGTPLLGGFSEKTTAPRDTAKRLVIRGVALMGGVDVHN